MSGDEPDAQKLAEARRARRRCAVADLAVQQHGVVSLRELYDVGLTRSEVRAEVRAGCGARVRHRGSSVDVRQSRRWSAADVQPGSRPARTRTPVAAVRAGLWAASDRQAALVLTMAVQQRLVTADQLGAELLRVRRDKRRCSSTRSCSTSSAGCSRSASSTWFGGVVSQGWEAGIAA